MLKVLILIFSITFCCLLLLDFACCSIQHQSKVFHEIFVDYQKLNIDPLEIITDVPNTFRCFEHCMHRNDCLSVNYQDRPPHNCELLGEDRMTRGKDDFSSALGYVYYDTAYRDFCNEENSCYPCLCWSSAQFYRSPCNCKHFTNGVKFHAPSNPINVIINRQNLMLYCLGSLGHGKVYSHPADMNSQWNVAAGPFMTKINIRQDGKLTGISGTPSDFYRFNSSWELIVRYPGVIADYDYTNSSDIVFIADATKDLFQISAVQAATKIATGNISRIQKHSSYWYAIGLSCKCIMRHFAEPSPTESKWEVITENPGSSVEFKVNFNDVIYSLHEDQNIYKWDEEKIQWVKVFNGPCAHFDVYHYIVCQRPLPNAYIDTESNHIPRPNIHIPFKWGNTSGGYTPFARGSDNFGSKKILLDMIDNNIALDQFGKGFVLQKGDGAKLYYGTFHHSALGDLGSFQYSQAFTFAFWVRITQQTETCDLFTLQTATSKGLAISLKDFVKPNLKIWVILNLASEHYAVSYPATESDFYSWTHVAVMGATIGSLHLFVNGTRVVSDTVPYTGYVYDDAYEQFHTNCKGVYISELAIWYGIFQDRQISRLFDYELNYSPGWNKKFLTVTESSCQELKQQRRFTTSGYYWIKLQGDIVSVYCDMVADGGGCNMTNIKIVELH